MASRSAASTRRFSARSNTAMALLRASLRLKAPDEYVADAGAVAADDGVACLTEIDVVGVARGTAILSNHHNAPHFLHQSPLFGTGL